MSTCKRGVALLAIPKVGGRVEVHICGGMPQVSFPRNTLYVMSFQFDGPDFVL